MNYQPSSNDFVVENPQAKTFFVNREVFVSDGVFEREKRAIFDRSGFMSATLRSSKIPATSRPGR